MYEIESNVPPPAMSRFAEKCQTLQKMEVGNSIVVDSAKERNMFQQASRHTKIPLMTRRVIGTNTWRIWRLADWPMKLRASERRIIATQPEPQPVA